MSRPRQGSRLTFALHAALVVLIGGAVTVFLFGLADTDRFSWLAPSATAVAASVAALTALRLNESADERRAAALAASQQDRRIQQRDRYEKLVQQLLTQFQRAAPDESARRAELAVWGSSELVDAMNRWYEYVRLVLASGGTVPPDKMKEIQQLVADIALLARALSGIDLDGTAPSRNDMGRLLFDDWVQ
ncbi:hypothetical protein [Curtobacterium sp. 320]|uniref:hypothetical protein n=1 Tax=Curtobacterium sp. 320 TaxID=2817749 RepID=UPI00286A8E7D|nr:hypothetical protein [Curtobacterium sp. 320]